MKSLLTRTVVSAGVILLLALASCEDRQDNSLPPIPVQTAILNWEQGSQTAVPYAFSGSWQAECTDSRFSVSPISGNGSETELTVTAETANSGLSERTSSFTVIDGDSAPASVYIVQKGTPQIRPVLSALSSSAAATGITVGADANTPLTYSVNADWLEISSVEVSDSTLLGDGRTHSDSLRYSLSVNLEANTGDSPRNAVLTLMAEGKDTVEITVTQEAEPQADFSKSFFKGTCIMRFTATWCYNCPRMRRAIEAVAGQMPDRIVPINMYDMSSDGGLGFWEINHYMNLLEVTGFPTAIASNCIKIQNSSTSEAVMEIVEAVVNESIESYPANTAMEVYSSVAGDNVRVEGYIAIKDGSKNYTVNVFLLEDNITYPQSDESGTINDYAHSGVVRAVLTGETGEPLQCDGSESTVHFSVEGEIPRSVLNADNLSVAVIVAYEGSPEVRTVAMAKYLETGQVYDNAVLLKANGGHSAFKYE